VPELTIENLDKALAALDPKMLDAPLRELLTKAALRIEADAKANAPADSGQLRRTITHQVDQSEPPLEAVVGTNLSYAPYMEYGTGLLAEGDPAFKQGSGPHYPPGNALNVWAERHGFESGGQVATAIGRRGGLEPRRFLRNAFEGNQGFIAQLVAKCMDRIAAIWSKNG